ncbi:MAG TPA: HNH endonuclease signature motif containing protein [Streptosporangiaceae bacterium]|nr:HNH endonuclease signature motif containing protein [Streptosporangiaceae bacterium]
MTDPPFTPPPEGGRPAGSASTPACQMPAMASAGDDYLDLNAVLAGFDSDLQGPGPAVLEDRAEPAWLTSDYPGPDEDDDDDDAELLAALALDAGAGFAERGPLDALGPGGALAGCAGHAIDNGLATLSDGALVGLLRASRRLAAWQNGVELAAVAELDRRRLRDSRRPGWSKVSDTIAAELAAALILTGRSADTLLCLARDLTRLPAVLAALLDGRIDRARAAVFAAELAALAGPAAAMVAGELLPAAPALTTGQLRHALRTLIHLLDPDAIRTRMHKARKDCRVEAWGETSGNHGLAGRELDPADALAADQRITAIARSLHAAGAPGTLDQVRAHVFTALLAGRDPDTLLPPADPTGECHDSQPGRATGAADGTGTGTARLGGTVHLTMPVSSWLGHTDLPGEAARLGPIDAWTSRRLANQLAASRALTRWCITLVRPDGTAAAHACTTTPPPEASASARYGWLTGQRYTWLDHGRCSHGNQTRGYQPPNAICDLVKARHRTCAFPGCRRPAVRCDVDHTIPYGQGGRTCPCNLAPLCRQHHQVKQTPAWTLQQPEPGVLTWTAPHGRSYTVTPTTYIC